MSFLLLTNEGVEFGNQLVCIRTVYHASLFNAFALRCRAAQTVHADFHEELCGLDVDVENLADRGLFRNSHEINLLLFERYGSTALTVFLSFLLFSNDYSIPHFCADCN